MMRCIILVVAVLLASCHRGGHNDMTKAAEDSSSVAFADYLRIYGNTLVSRNTWQAESSSEQYRLVPRDCTVLLVSDIMAIPVPVQSCICMSTTYLPAIQMLGKAEAVKGVSGTRFIYDSVYRIRTEKGLIADVGAENSPDYEKILSLKCDVVFAYGIEGSDNSYIEKLRKLGQRVIVINDYLESSVAGRLEYLKLYGSLFCQTALADSLFCAKKDSYWNLACRYAEAAEQAGATSVNVLVNMPFKGVWYVPGGHSYMAELIRDAGGELLGQDFDESTSSSRNGFELMYSKKNKADVWIHLNSASTEAEVLSENPLFKNIKAVKDKRLYNNIKRMTPDGGSDYWESGALYPDQVLADLIQIFHPDVAGKLFPGRELKYYIRL